MKRNSSPALDISHAGVGAHCQASQSLTDAQNATIMKLTLLNTELRKELNEVKGLRQSSTSDDLGKGSKVIHTATQTDAVIVCPKFRVFDAAVQCSPVSMSDASTCTNAAPILVDAHIQASSHPPMRNGRIPGRAVQTDNPSSEQGSQTSPPSRKNRHTQSVHECDSVGVQTYGVEVTNRGCSACPEVADSCDMTDQATTSIDAVWLGKATSLMAFQDVKTKFADISNYIYITRISKLVFLVIFSACEWHERIANAALGVSHLIKWCPIDKIQMLVDAFPCWAWNSQRGPLIKDTTRVAERTIAFYNRSTHLLAVFFTKWHAVVMLMKKRRSSVSTSTLLSKATPFFLWKLSWASQRYMKTHNLINARTDVSVDELPPPPPPPPMPKRLGRWFAA